MPLNVWALEVLRHIIRKEEMWTAVNDMAVRRPEEAQKSAARIFKDFERSPSFWSSLSTEVCRYRAVSWALTSSL
ncbi:hypothetical protein A5657_03800 [Mycobacterium kubicae]|nr:hypothetical protein A5657_03800 [Mycobacterium kubicae]